MRQKQMAQTNLKFLNLSSNMLQNFISNQITSTFSRFELKRFLEPTHQFTKQTFIMSLKYFIQKNIIQSSLKLNFQQLYLCLQQDFVQFIEFKNGLNNQRPKYSMKKNQQPSQLESLSQIQNPSARLNEQQNRPVQKTFFQKFISGQIISFSQKNILKGIVLIIIIFLTFWMASNFLQQSLIRYKTPFKFGASSSDVQQIAAPDQIAYKSFYYYQKMVQLAKKNVKQDQNYQIGQQDNQQYSKIGFWQLYGIFKVVKAIQLANGYQVIDYNDKQTDDAKYQATQNLTSVVNLTNYFNKPADQARCASCYSFPVTATIQYLIYKKYNIKVKLSQQQLIDCSNPNETANGCNDGNITRSFQYARDIGLVEEKNYPYRSQEGYSYKCNKKLLEDQSVKKYKIKGFRALPMTDCKAIQYQLVHGNAVAAVIHTGRTQDIKNYSQPFRSCSKDKPNHAITIVGQTENQDWIVRNSWGESWGNNGYYVIKKGNTCGICNTAFVPYFDDQQSV